MDGLLAGQRMAAFDDVLSEQDTTMIHHYVKAVASRTALQRRVKFHGSAYLAVAAFRQTSPGKECCRERDDSTNEPRVPRRFLTRTFYLVRPDAYAMSFFRLLTSKDC